MFAGVTGFLAIALLVAAGLAGFCGWRWYSLSETNAALTNTLESVRANAGAWQRHAENLRQQHAVDLAVARAEGAKAAEVVAAGSKALNRTEAAISEARKISPAIIPRRQSGARHENETVPVADCSRAVAPAHIVILLDRSYAGAADDCDRSVSTASADSAGSCSASSSDG